MQTIQFEFEHDGMLFSDSITLNHDHGLSEQQIESMKQARFEQWKQLLTPQDTED
jgi:hypothetical protein